MEQTIQDNLCKGLRACGIPRRQSHQLLNIFEKWYQCNGAEWTNSRIKDLRQWYETCLTGEPKPPKWFRHSTDGYPLGIWKWVFDLKPAKALGILSMNTVLYEEKLSETQKEKFLHAINGNGKTDEDYLEELYASGCIPRYNEFHGRRLSLPFQKMPQLKFPTIFDMNGSIPIHDGRSSVRPNEKLGKALEALRSSWESVPQVTFDFLDNQDLLGYMPMSVVGNEYQLELNRPHDRCVGRVSVLQQPQLKARIVGNPNRVLQVTLEPLKKLFMEQLQNVPTDVTHDQESGIRWVQNALKQGRELAGSDLTSASDLLDVRLCLKLVDRVYGFPAVHGYKDYREYFLEVSRSPWWCPALDCEVQWRQGDVLGTGPSFGLLSLTNNAAALTAIRLAEVAGVLPRQSTWKSDDFFRVVGDDIVMDSRLEPYYTKVIESLGGEINHSKTLKSDRVAEFAGRVITSEQAFLKALKYSEPSDNSFMSYVAQLGDQAKYLLQPKQRQVYDLLKEVPGVVVAGPWVQDSYGIPLGKRYSWYLEEVQPALERAEPTLLLTDYDMVLLKAQLSLSEAGQIEQEHQSFDEPLFGEGYLPSQVTPSFKVGGDPRLTNGKTLLDTLHQHVEKKDIQPYQEWVKEESEASVSNAADELPQSVPLDENEPSFKQEESSCPQVIPVKQVTPVSRVDTVDEDLGIVDMIGDSDPSSTLETDEWEH